MSLHYVIDGYNLLKRLRNNSQPGIEDRSSLLKFLSEYSSRRKVQITIVFDGYGYERLDYLKVKVCFSRDISADEYILSFLKDKTRKKNYRVVTDDLELRFKLKNLGIEVMEVNKFFCLAEKKVSPKVIGKIREKPSLYSKQAQELRKELEEIWIQKKSRS